MNKKNKSVQCVRYYHTDQIGMPFALHEANGTLSWQADQRVWGGAKRTDTVGTGDAQRRIAAFSDQSLRFQGQYFDAETELHYNAHRYYDPDVARFLTQDPIGLEGGIHAYGYAPNPRRWIDPLGLAVDLSLVGSNNPSCGLDIFPDTYQILSHGTQDGHLVDGAGNYINPDQLCSYLKGAPGYKPGTPITLYACFAGCGDEKAFGQHVSNKMNVKVNAPTNVLKTCPIGGGDVIGMVINGGKWKQFSPMPGLG